MSNKPNKMEFTIDSITEGIEYWLANQVLRDSVKVERITWNSQSNKFIVDLATDQVVIDSLSG